MGSEKLTDMSDAELLSMIFRARAIMSDRAKARREEFRAAIRALDPLDKNEGRGP